MHIKLMAFIDHMRGLFTYQAADTDHWAVKHILWESYTLDDMNGLRLACTVPFKWYLPDLGYGGWCPSTPTVTQLLHSQSEVEKCIPCAGN